MRKTKIESVIQQIRDQISNQTLIAGTRLPSVRQYAVQQGFSVSTIVEAYARLVAEGLIESRMGAGYYVLSPQKAQKLEWVNHQTYQREVDPLWISRQALDAQAEVLKPGCGWLPDSWLPEKLIRKALKLASQSETSLLTEYATPYGHLPLRQWLGRKKQFTDIALNLNQILITDSATQSIDLIFRLLLKPGDIILIDDPCYFNFQALIQAHHLKAIAIPMTIYGPDLKQFERALDLKPKIYLTNSGIHNPTGVSLALQHVYQIAKMAEQADMLIIEDEIFADFELNPTPRYASLVGFNHVIQIGSFSKTLSGAIRCGFIIANEKMVDRIVDLRIATSFSHSQLNAEIIYQVLKDPLYAKYLDHLRNKLLLATKQTQARLQILDIQPWVIPKAGIFLWCQLPQDIDAAALSKYCVEQGLILAPGPSFSSAQYAQHFMRFNVAQCINERVFSLLEQAMRYLRGHENISSNTSKPTK